MKSQKIKRLAKELQIDGGVIDHARILTDAEAALRASGRMETARIRTLPRHRLSALIWAGGLAAAFFLILSWLACFVLSTEVADLRHQLELAQCQVAAAGTDESATINLYLREHQDVAARTASFEPPVRPPVRMDVSRHDVLYYEFLDDRPEFMRPGVIVRGPSAPRKLGPPDASAIANGHTLSLTEARQTADFELVSPAWLHPGYRLDQIRRIEGQDTLHMLYTDGTNSLSLFEQPLEGRRGLEPQDFREYAIYCSKGQAGWTILAWRDDVLFYVLVGNAEMSQLMNMAQSINSAIERK
jgi:hypothetical protein